MNVAELLTIPAMSFPDQEILRFEGRGTTYAALVEQVEHLAGALRALGVVPDDRVAVLETNTPTVVATLFATALVGATFVPLNYRARADELSHMLRVAQPRVLLTGERYLALAREVLAETEHQTALLTLEAPESRDSGEPSIATLAAAAPPESSDALLGDEGLAVLLFTSGTTAYAKAVMLGHADLTGYVIGTTELASGESDSTVLVAAPLYHVAGLTAVLAATFAGRRLVIMRQFDAEAWLRLVEQEQVTHAFLVPTMLKRVLDHPLRATTDLSSLRLISYGAAPMPTEVIRRAIQELPPRIEFLNAFGQTETTSTVTVLGPEDHRLEGTPAEIEARLRRLGSVGRPLPDVEIQVMDSDGHAVPVGEIGEVAIRTERMMRGYLGQADATAATVQSGWLMTRDLGWMDEQGYLFLAGRSSDVIIRGGENIAPDEVEAVLASHPAVEEAAVFGLPDEEWGERVTAAIVPRPGESPTSEELIAFSRQRLASYKTPERIVFVDELPRNSLGKVMRRDLRAQVAGPTADTRQGRG